MLLAGGCIREDFFALFLTLRSASLTFLYTDGKLLRFFFLEFFCLGSAVTTFVNFGLGLQRLIRFLLRLLDLRCGNGGDEGGDSVGGYWHRGRILSPWVGMRPW